MEFLSTEPDDENCPERVETQAFFLTRRKSDEISTILLLQKLKSNVENESSEARHEEQNSPGRSPARPLCPVPPADADRAQACGFPLRPQGSGPPPPRAWPGAVHMPGPGQGLRPAPRRCCALWFSLLGLFFDCSSGRTLARSSPQEHPVILRSEEQQVHRAAGGPCAGSRVCHQHLQRSLSLYDDAVCSEASLLVLFSLNELAFI